MLRTAVSEVRVLLFDPNRFSTRSVRWHRTAHGITPAERCRMVGGFPTLPMEGARFYKPAGVS
jgi:hypothetical protein